MKISLFIKPSLLKAYVLLLIIVYVACQPSPAYAGFFSNIMDKIMGKDAFASEITLPVASGPTRNSQTIQLPESSINPDIKNIKDEPIVLALVDDTVIANDGSLDVASDLENYASDAKITTYVVKKGDTLSEISEKLNVPQSSIIAANTDLKKSDLLKPGQTLAIIATRTSKTTIESEKPAPKEKTVAKKEVKKKEEPKIVAKIVAPKPETQKIAVADKVEVEVAVGSDEDDSNTKDQPSDNVEGTAKGSYIWPFPAGSGRISQRLHSDNAYDFAAPKGTPIYAVQSGTVLIAKSSGYNGGYGLYVVVDFDDGRQAIFAHMSKVSASAGDRVKQGEIIGYVGNTGKSTGPHLHLGFRGSLGNPYAYLKVGNSGI